MLDIKLELTLTLVKLASIKALLIFNMLTINDMLTNSLLQHLGGVAATDYLERCPKHAVTLSHVAQTIAALKLAGVCSIDEDSVNLAIANLQLQSEMNSLHD
ncbi:MAG: hypothetical protein KatS3mg087_0605 [Patescibacteria group bacterium]|nr:MAG: hypothetical protein KatS3mg087_0605 [Patescibacteria group bacterium]